MLLVLTGPTTHKQLKVIAELVWCSGGLILLYKAGVMLYQANTLTQVQSELWLAVIAGLVIGSLKVKFLFRRFCKRNLDRITALPKPQLWQCFRPRFICFLLLMIVLGKILSTQAQGNYPFLIAMAILDISLAIALLGSSTVFWSERKVKPDTNINK